MTNYSQKVPSHTSSDEAGVGGMVGSGGGVVLGLYSNGTFFTVDYV